MEAATPLRQPRITILANAVVVDGLTITDAATVQLIRTRVEAGEAAEKVVSGALDIGARVLDREQAGATVELFRADLEKSTREADAALAKSSDQVTREILKRVDELFGPDTGHVTRVLQRHFADESSVAVQHRIRKAVDEMLTDSRERLLKLFSSADGSNPLADFKNAHVGQFRRLADQQDANLRAMTDQITALTVEVQKLQSEKDKQAEVAAEHERSTAKGRPYEDAVLDAVGAIAQARGDDCDAVGDVRGAGGRKGDVLVGIDGCSGPARGRIVFEAKHSQKSKKAALTELDEAMAQRDAAYGVWVVPSEDLLPARTLQLQEVNGDKVFVVYDPEDGSRLALEVAYALARARMLMARADGAGLDAAAVRAEVERSLMAMEDVRRIKSQLTTAAGGIEQARSILTALDDNVREHLRQIDGMLAAAGAPEQDQQRLLG
jgi:hypothetical protein